MSGRNLSTTAVYPIRSEGNVWEPNLSPISHQTPQRLMKLSVLQSRKILIVYIGKGATRITEAILISSELLVPGTV